MRKLWPILLCLFWALPALGQGGQFSGAAKEVTIVTAAPSGGCSNGREAIDIVNHALYFCAGGTWYGAGGVGGGGITSLNGLTAGTQLYSLGTMGLDLNWVSDIDTHTLNVPDASATARGVMTPWAQIVGGPKTFPDGISVDSLEITGADSSISFDELADCSDLVPTAGVTIYCSDLINGAQVSSNGGDFSPVLTAASSPTIAAVLQNGLTSGGSVAYTGTGLVFTVQAASYVIAGVAYTSRNNQRDSRPC